MVHTLIFVLFLNVFSTEAMDQQKKEIIIAQEQSKKPHEHTVLQPHHNKHKKHHKHPQGEEKPCCNPRSLKSAGELIVSVAGAIATVIGAIVSIIIAVPK